MPIETLSDGTYVLDDPTPLPDVLDMLIVGGGPAATAAAFRAKELGLTALVIDYDDLMKRIRDYAADKFILPHFGGGDKMKFPKGGDLISQLCFAPIDKDDMCATWKGFYCRYSIPAQIGVELTGLPMLQGNWQASRGPGRMRERSIKEGSSSRGIAPGDSRSSCFRRRRALRRRPPSDTWDEPRRACQLLRRRKRRAGTRPCARTRRAPGSSWGS